MVVGNSFFRLCDGWHDIRVHRFAKTFQQMGYDPVVYCRADNASQEEAGVYDGIRFRRLLFRGAAPTPTSGLDPDLVRSNGFPGAAAESPPARVNWRELPPKRKALYILRKGPRIAARRSYRLLRRTLRRGWHVGMWPVRRARALARRARSRFASKFLHYFNRSFTQAFLEATAGERPSIIYAADLNTLIGAAELARRTGAKLVYDSHEYFLSRAEHEWMGFIHRRWDRFICARLERKYFPQASVVLSVSEGIVNAFRERIPEGRYLCVRNTSVPEGAGEPLNVIREKLDLSATTKIALYIGFITGGRGIREIIDAAAFLPDDMVVALLGGGRQLQEQYDYTAERGLAHKVHFLGQVPQVEVFDYARSADCGLCLIQPTCLSYYYSMPNKMFQYIGCGLPVVCSDFPDMRDLVERYDIGAAVDPTAPRDIAAAIERLLGDDEARARRRRNCLEAVRTDLNWQAEVGRLRELGLFQEARRE